MELAVKQLEAGGETLEIEDAKTELLCSLNLRLSILYNNSGIRYTPVELAAQIMRWAVNPSVLIINTIQFR